MLKKSPQLGILFLVLRLFNNMSAIAIMVNGFAQAVLVESKEINNPYAGPRETGRASTFIALAVFQILFASLILATEALHLRCIARYFGFMAMSVTKGCYSILCGLMVIWYHPRGSNPRTSQHALRSLLVAVAAPCLPHAARSALTSPPFETVRGKDWIRVPRRCAACHGGRKRRRQQ